MQEDIFESILTPLLPKDSMPLTIFEPVSNHSFKDMSASHDAKTDAQNLNHVTNHLHTSPDQISLTPKTNPNSGNIPPTPQQAFTLVKDTTTLTQTFQSTMQDNTADSLEYSDDAHDISNPREVDMVS